MDPSQDHGLSLSLTQRRVDDEDDHGRYAVRLEEVVVGQRALEADVDDGVDHHEVAHGHLYMVYTGEHAGEAAVRERLECVVSGKGYACIPRS